MKKQRRNHSQEFKREAVALVVEHGYSCAAAGRSLGVSGALIGRWKQDLADNGAEAFPGKGKRTAEQQRIHELETENRRLRMEKDILKKATAFFAKEKLMRYRFIDEHKKAWPVILMCDVLSVSRSGYYDWTGRSPSRRAQSNRKLDSRIHDIFARHRQRYGAPRITDALHDEGIECSENRVARRMRVQELKAIQAKKFKVTTDSNHTKPVAPDLVEQDFSATAPNQNGPATSAMFGPTRAGCISRW